MHDNTHEEVQPEYLTSPALFLKAESWQHLDWGRGCDSLLPHCVTNTGLHKGSLGSWKYFGENFLYYSEYGVLNKCIGLFSHLGWAIWLVSDYIVLWLNIPNMCQGTPHNTLCCKHLFWFLFKNNEFFFSFLVGCTVTIYFSDCSYCISLALF